MAIAAAGLLAACSVQVNPLTEAENTARVESDREALFADLEVISGPIFLEEAIARALMYNLDHRLKQMERAVGLQQLDVANSSLLPTVAANAGYDTRSRADTTFNEDRTGTSTTSDRKIRSGDLTVSWNVLDFGIGYIRAQQQADLALIVEERRRQVIHNVMQDTRAAYWRAVAAERSLERVEELTVRVEQALDEAEEQVEAQVDPIDAMEYQRSLLETLRALAEEREAMQAARAELAVLMNVHPDSDFVLADALDAPAAVPENLALLTANPVDLETSALANRSELRSEAYQLRVFQEEARVALLEMIPGLSFSAGINETSDSFKANQNWHSGSIDLTWNVLSVFQSPEKIALAETQQELSRVRRLALSMAVIAQVHVAQLRLGTAYRDYAYADRVADLSQDIREEVENAFVAAQRAERDVIEAEVRAVAADLARDVAYAELQDAIGRLISSTGADPLIDIPRDRSGDLMAVTEAVGSTLTQWNSGSFSAPLRSLAEEEEGEDGGWLIF